MPIFDRRPQLASLVVPPLTGFGLSEGVKTPIPHTPMACSPIEAPMVMTPDTPGFNMPSIENALAQKQKQDATWTEQEDELLASYLSHPPRPLRNTYPPHSLPPPEALEELVAQILASPAWPAQRTPLQTRSRLVDIARQRVTAYQLGPKREPLVVMPSTVAPRKTARPRLTLGAGSFGLSRQQNSMDSLYGDNEGVTFSEALRLSSTLQDTASTGTTEELSSVGSLSSPLDFTFTFNPTASSTKSFGKSPIPRPPSLLQRGRSFTGQDLADIPMTIDEGSSAEDDSHMDLDGHGRQSSSPESSFTASPPSSVSSNSLSEDVEEILAPAEQVYTHSGMGYFGMPRSAGLSNLARGYGTLQDVEVDPEPFTPLNATFFNAITPLNPPSGGSSTGMSTPAITLTVDSPELASDTPRLLSAGMPSRSSNGPTSPTATTRAFANMSLNSRSRNPPPAPGPVRRTRIPSIPLSRSLSDGMLAGPNKTLTSVIPQSISLSRLSESSESADQRGHTLARPMVKRQKSNTPELSVFVPRPGGKNWTDELKSPFEHKPAGSGSSMSESLSSSSSNSSTATLTALR